MTLPTLGQFNLGRSPVQVIMAKLTERDSVTVLVGWYATWASILGVVGAIYLAFGLSAQPSLTSLLYIAAGGVLVMVMLFWPFRWLSNMRKLVERRYGKLTVEGGDG